jgi:hypothetical protein
MRRRFCGEGRETGSDGWKYEMKWRTSVRPMTSPTQVDQSPIENLQRKRRTVQVDHHEVRDIMQLS